MTAAEVQAGVELALRAAHAQRERVGRALHPVEVRWVVRGAFREVHHAVLMPAQADHLADQMIEVIRLHQQATPNEGSPA